MMILIDCILGLALLLFFLSIPAGVAHAIIETQIELKCPDRVMHYRYLGGSCWGMKGCGDDTCHLKNHCYLYKDSISPEEIAKIERKLEERKKQRSSEDQ